MNTKRQRTIALLICAVVLAAALFSAFFVARQANHVCTDDNCPICACIHTAEQALRQSGHSPAAHPFALFLMAIMCPAFMMCVLPMVLCSTPIGQKVRQNN